MADITTYYYGGTDTPYGTYPDRTAYIGGEWNVLGGMGMDVPPALLAELSASDDWEIYFKHEFPDYAGFLLSAWADSGKQTRTVYIGYFGYSTGNRLRLFFKDADGSEVLAEEPDVSLSKGTDTYHEVKITFASGVLSVQTRAQDTDEWTTCRSCQSSKNISFGTCGTYGDDFGFKIYSDRCYIKIGGQYRWSATGTLYVPDAQQETPGGDEPSIDDPIIEEPIINEGEDMGITQIRQNQVRGLESSLAGMASAISGKADVSALAGLVPSRAYHTHLSGTSQTFAEISGKNSVKIYKNGLLLRPAADEDTPGTLEFAEVSVSALLQLDNATIELDVDGESATAEYLDLTNAGNLQGIAAAINSGAQGQFYCEVNSAGTGLLFISPTLGASSRVEINASTDSGIITALGGSENNNMVATQGWADVSADNDYSISGTSVTFTESLNIHDVITTECL